MRDKSIFQDGKSTVACNLALSHVQTGGSAVVVDCNFRAPILHKVFGIPESPGLAQLLAGEMATDKILYHPRAGMDLAVVPAGDVQESLPNVLHLRDKAFLSFLEELRRRYSLVVLDGPEGARVGEAQSLASSADATVLVVVPGYTRRADTRRTLLLLGQTRARIIGVIANKAAPIRHKRA